MSSTALARCRKAGPEGNGGEGGSVSFRLSVEAELSESTGGRGGALRIPDIFFFSLACEGGCCTVGTLSEELRPLVERVVSLVSIEGRYSSSGFSGRMSHTS